MYCYSFPFSLLEDDKNKPDDAPPYPEKCQPECSEEDKYGQVHNACPGATSFRSCPKGSNGSIAFECPSIQSIKGRLNYSNCSSNWITELKNFVTEVNT